MRKIIHIFLSLVIVYASTVSAYADVSASWSVTGSVMNGASATISAIKGSGSNALKSVISYAPTVGAVTKEIVKVGGLAGLAYAASELLGAGVDYLIDSSSQTLKYSDDNTPVGFGFNSQNLEFSSADDACAHFMATTGRVGSDWSLSRVTTVSASQTTGQFFCYSSYRGVEQSPQSGTYVLPQEYNKSIPLSSVAQKILSNAAAGHAESQEGIKSVAVSAVNAGELDNQLQAAATVVNPDVTDPNDPTAPPFDPSSIISALQSVMSAITNMSASIKAKLESMTTVLSDKIDEMIGKQTETNQVINDGMADVVAANNATGARVGDVVAAIEALEGNTLDGQVINDAVDRAIAAGHTDAASIVAAIEQLDGNSLDSSVINEAVDRVIENNKAIADKVAAEKVAADEKVAAEKAAADKAAADQFEEVPPEKTQSETDVPVDLPPEVKNPNEFDVDYVSFGGQCPVLSPFSVGVGAFSSSMTFDMSPLCNLAITIRPAIIAIAYFIGLGVIASAIRET